MSSNHKYIIPVFNAIFKSLEDAKWNLKLAFTRKEALKYLTHISEFNDKRICHESILHFIGDKLVSRTPINVDELGNISFGRTRMVTQ